MSMATKIHKCEMCLHNDDPNECMGCVKYSNYYPMSPSLAAAAASVQISDAINEGIKSVVGHPDPVGAPGEPGVPRILDSGNRRQFESGAVRDIQEGKGRCDLLPLDVVAFLYAEREDLTEDDCTYAWVFYYISRFQETGQIDHLRKALEKSGIFAYRETMLLEVAIHFEEGAKKYGDNNWRKGIPVRCYIDSGVRHYLKFLRGDKDEPHDRAFCWNMMCAIWTCEHHPELNDYHDVNKAIVACNDILKRMGEFDQETAEKFWGEADTNG